MIVLHGVVITGFKYSFKKQLPKVFYKKKLFLKNFWRPGDVLKWHPGDVLIWRSKDVLWGVDSGRPQELLRTSPRRPSEYPNVDAPNIFFNFSFRTYSTDQIYRKAFQHSRCIENPVKLLGWSIFCKIS